MNKRLLSMLLAIVMIFSIVPVSAFAEGEAEPQTVTVTFVIPEGVTLTNGSGDSFTEAQTINAGERFAFKVHINEAYEKTDSFSVEGANPAGNNGSSYNTGAVNEDRTVTISGVQKKTFSVTCPTEGVELVPGASYADIDFNNIPYGTKIKFQIKLKDGYAAPDADADSDGLINQCKINGSSKSSNSGTFGFDEIQQNYEITVDGVRPTSKTVTVYFRDNGVYLGQTETVTVDYEDTTVNVDDLKNLVPNSYKFLSADGNINVVNGQNETYVDVDLKTFPYEIKFFVGSKDNVVGTDSAVIEGIETAPVYALPFNGITTPAGYALDAEEGSGDYLDMGTLYVPVKSSELKSVTLKFLDEEGSEVADAETLVPADLFTFLPNAANLGENLTLACWEDANGKEYALGEMLEWDEIAALVGNDFDKHGAATVKFCAIPTTKKVTVYFRDNGVYLDQTATVTVDREATTVDTEELKTLVPTGYKFLSANGQINVVNGKSETYVDVDLKIFPYEVKFYIGNKDNVVATDSAVIEGTETAPVYAIRFGDVTIPQGYALDANDQLGDYLQMNALYVPVKSTELRSVTLNFNDKAGNKVADDKSLVPTDLYTFLPDAANLGEDLTLARWEDANSKAYNLGSMLEWSAIEALVDGNFDKYGAATVSFYAIPTTKTVNVYFRHNSAFLTDEDNNYLKDTITIGYDDATVDSEKLKTLVPNAYKFVKADGVINVVNGENETYVDVALKTFSYTAKFYIGSKDNVVATESAVIEGTETAPVYAIRFSDVTIPQGYALDAKDQLGDYLQMNALYVPVKATELKSVTLKFNDKAGNKVADDMSLVHADLYAFLPDTADLGEGQTLAHWEDANGGKHELGSMLNWSAIVTLVGDDFDNFGAATITLIAKPATKEVSVKLVNQKTNETIDTFPVEIADSNTTWQQIVTAVASKVATPADYTFVDGEYKDETVILYYNPNTVEVAVKQVNKKTNETIGTFPVEIADSNTTWQQIVAAAASKVTTPADYTFVDGEYKDETVILYYNPNTVEVAVKQVNKKTNETIGTFPVEIADSNTTWQQIVAAAASKVTTPADYTFVDGEYKDETVILYYNSTLKDVAVKLTVSFLEEVNGNPIANGYFPDVTEGEITVPANTTGFAGWVCGDLKVNAGDKLAYADLVGTSTTDVYMTFTQVEEAKPETPTTKTVKLNYFDTAANKQIDEVEVTVAIGAEKVAETVVAENLPVGYEIISTNYKIVDGYVYIEVCKHTNQKLVDLDNGMHQLKCTDCGKAIGKAENHTKVYESLGKDTHHQVCDDCGAETQAAAEHSKVYQDLENGTHKWTCSDCKETGAPEVHKYNWKGICKKCGFDKAACRHKYVSPKHTSRGYHTWICDGCERDFGDVRCFDKNGDKFCDSCNTKIVSSAHAFYKFLPDFLLRWL